MTYWLYNARLRIERAVEHLQALSDDIDAADEAKPLSSSLEKEAKTGWKIVRLKVLTEPSPRLGLRAGEVCYQLRAALDNLVADLVAASGARVSRRHCFPIVIWPRMWNEANIARWLGGIRPEWIAVIHEYQPFLRDKPSRVRCPLWMLSRLSNLDKHRAVPPSFVMMGREPLTVEPVDPTVSWEILYAKPMAALHDNTELCRILTRPDPDSTVNVKGNLRFPLGFGEPAATILDLRGLAALVETIVDRFDPV